MGLETIISCIIDCLHVAFILLAVIAINSVAARSMQPHLSLNESIEQRFSKAISEERLEDALKIFLEEWESRHGIKSRNRSVSEEMQADYPLVIAVDDSVSDDGYRSATNCTRCVMHEEARQRRLQEIKLDILNKLGLKQAPNVTSKTLPRIPPLHHLLDRYGILGDDPQTLSSSSRPGQDSPPYDEEEMPSDQPPDAEDDGEDFYVNTERAISFAQKPPDSWQVPKELKSQYFQFTAKVMNSHLTKAHLWIYAKPSEEHMREEVEELPAWVVVYQMVKAKRGDSPTLMLVREKKIQVNAKKGNWVKIEVKKLVTQWIRYPNENIGLVVHSYDSKGREFIIRNPDDNSDLSKRTFIDLKVETKTQNRKRRMIGLNCEENSNEVRCCRYPLTVDFEEFGWDWIIAPKRYEANYCSGECPYVFLQKYPHTHLVQQANPSGSAGPCCAPRKMSAISMLYFDDNYNIIYGMLPGMVVDRCGCS
ncbi:Growth/differentiation factor 8-like protein [Dinothrombium tinctorium]|uniref:Growth/differentiation factor 8-like protein n=1 Tax=Dinothrombium tinctorium TaxID=1965070 RepID=A0A3S3PMR7_9ACAR|nr:Growth/differentiation factor 8-like protein [Dinothrombium tinctorium]RWS12931.1 Growth/differentiation factor 8-like protein [Dinothrombium tinctorium]RWS13543.1 Growth/differentiation factor 8-like protein [Dinothrombium tinctorium]